MLNNVDSNQMASKPSDLNLHFWQKQGIGMFCRTRVNMFMLNFVFNSGATMLKM